MLATCLGFPRIGRDRELKKAVEAYWAGTSTTDELHATARQLRRSHWQAMKTAGIDHVPSNDFSLYDHVLDTAVMFGVVPPRFTHIADPLARYFTMARGGEVTALEMTKWFDTNYHYLVPELATDQEFVLDPARILTEIDEARQAGVEPRPVLLGPVSFLLLSKGDAPLAHLDALVAQYARLLGLLVTAGVRWVQLDEPCLVTDLDDAQRTACQRAFSDLSRRGVRPNILLATYFGGLDANLPLAMDSGFEALHVDLVRAPDQLPQILCEWQGILSLGVVDGRNIWRTDLERARGFIDTAVARLGEARVWVAPSCSLLHSPVDLARETKLAIRDWLAFAVQKLDELRAIATADTAAFATARDALAARRPADPAVRARLAALTPDMFHRRSPYPARATAQKVLGLPRLPTTTIGSFPQTGDVRGARAAWRAGKLNDDAYNAYLRDEIRRCLEKQEALGLDMLVHGEFERTDMVEHFGQLMNGFAFTEFGWVQSYGSRCVKPPIIFADVSRPTPMTVEWSAYAQSLTRRVMKGMLTGPVTILQWSFVRDDQPRRDTAMQIALALRDEVSDLEAAGIRAIQVDEPAIREGLPLRARDRAEYLRWAVDAFRLATSSVRDETQIHTHMCYSEFGEILGAIGELDADVLSIETSRSRMELFGDFARVGYASEVGPGVYDIHSPRVPTVDEIYDLLVTAAAVLPIERLWVNPDCGLKTRGWPEVEAALRHMVEAAHRMRGA